MQFSYSTSKPDKSELNLKIWSVSDLAIKIKYLLESRFTNIYVRGEVSEYHYHQASGHHYFVLKDQTAVLKCVFFKQRASTLDFEIEAGQDVIIGGQLSAYLAQGNYQVIVDSMLPGDKGLLEIKFEQLRAKLDAAGIFAHQHKKPVPTFAQKIGLVTAWDSDAWHDIFSITQARFPKIEYHLLPTAVTGKKAAPAIAAAIKKLDHYAKSHQLQVIILCRGGGAKEDLWAFNEEKVVKAVFRCKTPIISAIGHQSDITLADLAADYNAPTPSAAAAFVTSRTLGEFEEIINLSQSSLHSYQKNYISAMTKELASLEDGLQLCIENIILTKKTRLNDLLARLYLQETTKNLSLKLSYYKNAITQAMTEATSNAGYRLQTCSRYLTDFSPKAQYQKQVAAVKFCYTNLKETALLKLAAAKKQVAHLSERLGDQCPDNILKRGYTIISKNNRIITSASQTKSRDKITIKWHDGRKIAKIK